MERAKISIDGRARSATDGRRDRDSLVTGKLVPRLETHVCRVSFGDEFEEQPSEVWLGDRAQQPQRSMRTNIRSTAASASPASKR